MTEETLALPAPEQPKLLPAPDTPTLLPPPKSPAGGKNGDAGDARRRRRFVFIALAVIVVLLLIGWFFHHRRESQAEEANKDARDRLPIVSVVETQSSPATSDLRLPGSISPLTEASIFARASGYLATRYVDIGDTVHRGQLMAEIDSPDLDQQVAMARQQLDASKSAVNDAKARVALSQVTYERLAKLVVDQAVSQQQTDQGRQDLDTAKAGVVSSVANVGASQANLQRLVVLQGYEKVRAPFDGIVTARNVDAGALINGSGANSASNGTMNSSTSSSGTGASSASSSSSGTETQNGSGGASTELFRIAQADRVRVFVTVPQENAASVVPDTAANVFVQGFDEPFRGMVTRTAQALDPSARTLLTEVQVPNPQHRLVPGMYAQVGFQSPRRGTPLLIPGEAVMARADGLHVAVIEELTSEEREKLPKPDPAATKRRTKERDEKEKSGGSGEGKGDKSAGRGDAKDEKGGNDARKGRDGKRPPGSDDDPDDQDPSKARKIHLQTVEVGRDYGTEIEIVRGLRPGMTIVANPSDDVIDGAIVIAHAQHQKARGGDASPPAGAGDLPKNGDAAKTDSSADGKDEPTQGIGSPSMAAPTKGRH